MLTCIACSKQLGSAGGGQLHDTEDGDSADAGGGGATPSTRQAIKALTSQIKDMALKASGAYRHCKPCTGVAGGRGRHLHHQRYRSGYKDSEALSGSERFHYVYQRPGGGSSGESTPRLAAAAMGLRGAALLSSSDRTPSMSGRTEVSEMAEEEEEEDGDEPKEWVAQVEPGVLITFLSLPQGGNDLKRIRFSREMFDKWRAQRWWAENYEKVMELYNVQRFSHQAMPHPVPPISEDESSREDSPVTPPLIKERIPRNFNRAVMGGSGVGYSSSDSLEHHPGFNGQRQPCHGLQYHDSAGLTSTPKLSSTSGAKTEKSSVDASRRASSSAEEVDRSSELSVSISNASDQEREWVEEDEPGVYITIMELPGSMRELRRVRFSREMFSETHARLWWEQNRSRIHHQYL